MKLTVLGTGYVGLVSGTCFAEIGHDVVCVDVSREKVDRINNGDPPIHEPGLAELLQRNVQNGRLRATTSLDDGITDSDVTMIAVGTPFDGKEIDLTYIRGAAEGVGKALSGSRPHVVCVKSTVVPGTTESVVGPIVERFSGRKIGSGLGLAMNPEFLAEGTAVQDFMQPDRVVIGASDQQAADMVARLYAPFAGTDILITTPATAEMIKYSANSFLATVISFANEMANLSARLGVDVVDVMKGVHLDKRLTPLTPQGRVRPGLMSFLFPGTGFGGSCFPKDVKALIAHGEKMGSRMPILKAVIDTNERQPSMTVAMCREELGALRSKRVLILGLAFKPGTDDVRESPAIPIIRDLVKEGANVVAHDPIAIDNMRAVLQDLNVQFTDALTDAVKGVDAAVLVTSWPEYKELHTLLNAGSIPIIDGRRFLDPSKYERYRGIGARRNGRGERPDTGRAVT